jgi:lysozyme
MNINKRTFWVAIVLILFTDIVSVAWLLNHNNSKNVLIVGAIQRNNQDIYNLKTRKLVIDLPILYLDNKSETPVLVTPPPIPIEVEPPVTEGGDNIEEAPAEVEDTTEKDTTLFIEGVKHWEGFKSKVYVCSGGKTTIGYGFTGSEIKGRIKISQRVATKQLVDEVLPKHAAHVDEIVKVPLTHYQRLALISFSYNLGRQNLIRLVSGENRLNGGNYDSVVRLLPKYRKAGGVVSNGLVLRRSWEVDVFQGNIHTQYGN